ncbi:MAG: hypothetical protein V1708_02645 [Candidatus Micrarchaeota archaeon]
MGGTTARERPAWETHRQEELERLRLQLGMHSEKQDGGLPPFLSSGLMRRVNTVTGRTRRYIREQEEVKILRERMTGILGEREALRNTHPKAVMLHSLFPDLEKLHAVGRAVTAGNPRMFEALYLNAPVRIHLGLDGKSFHVGIIEPELERHPWIFFRPNGSHEVKTVVNPEWETNKGYEAEFGAVETPEERRIADAARDRAIADAKTALRELFGHFRIARKDVRL